MAIVGTAAGLSSENEPRLRLPPSAEAASAAADASSEADLVVLSPFLNSDHLVGAHEVRLFFLPSSGSSSAAVGDELLVNMEMLIERRCDLPERGVAGDAAGLLEPLVVSSAL